MLSKVLRPSTRRATRLRDSWTHAAVTRQRFYSSYPARPRPLWSTSPRPHFLQQCPCVHFISVIGSRVIDGLIYHSKRLLRRFSDEAGKSATAEPEALSLSFSAALVGAMISVQTIFRQLIMIPVVIYRAQRRQNLSSRRSPVYGPPSKPYRPAGVTSGRHGRTSSRISGEALTSSDFPRCK